MDPKQIIGIISIVVVTIASKYFWQHIKKKVDEDTKSNIIKQPSNYIVVGVMMIIGFAVIIAVIAIFSDVFESEASIAVIVVFSLGYLLAIYILLNSLNWKLELFDEYCIHTNIFGKKRTYIYKEIRVVDVSSGFRVYNGKRRIFDISGFQDNWKAFPQQFKKHNKIERR
jgi:membrane protein YdbS with pleckstrin-like domain